MTTKYEKLDALILARIKGGANCFAAIYVHDIRRECMRIASEEKRDAFRILDARLQALRKRGKIVFCPGGRIPGGWKIAPEESK